MARITVFSHDERFIGDDLKPRITGRIMLIPYVGRHSLHEEICNYFGVHPDKYSHFIFWKDSKAYVSLGFHKNILSIGTGIAWNVGETIHRLGYGMDPLED